MSRDEIEFISGLYVKPPHERAPDFVKASISIKVENMREWLETKAGEEWVNIDVKESRGGKWYASVSTYKKPEPGAQPAKKDTRTAIPSGAKLGVGKFDDMEDDIPF